MAAVDGTQLFHAWSAVRLSSSSENIVSKQWRKIMLYAKIQNDLYRE